MVFISQLKYLTLLVCSHACGWQRWYLGLATGRSCRLVIGKGSNHGWYVSSRAVQWRTGIHKARALTTRTGGLCCKPDERLVCPEPDCRSDGC